MRSDEAKAQRIMDYVHTLIYEAGIELDRDYVKFPLETIVEGNGDCEDLSILAAALMESIDIDVVLLHFDGNDGPGHLALGVKGEFEGASLEYQGEEFFFAEAAGTENVYKRSFWQIGEMPEELVGKSVIPYEVK